MREKSVGNSTTTSQTIGKETLNKKGKLSLSNNNNNNDKVNTKPQVVEETSSGQGELYSPEFALRLDTNQNPNNNSNDIIMMRNINIRPNLAAVKERLMEKLGAAAVPTEALDGARRMVEGVVRDVTVAAHALSKDALQRIKSHLREIIPSLSSAVTTKMVDDAEKEANNNDRNLNEEDQLAEDNIDHKINHDQHFTSTPNIHTPSSKL